jgi:hypothetical protein
MRKMQFALLALLPILALMAVLCLTIQPSFGQNQDDATRKTSSSAQFANTDFANTDNKNNSNSSGDRQNGEGSAITFQGRIVRSGNRLVLAAIDSTTYQLDNQQKAHNFLDHNVKITGKLDATTGTIRIHAIDPV